MLQRDWIDDIMFAELEDYCTIFRQQSTEDPLNTDAINGKIAQLIEIFNEIELNYTPVFLLGELRRSEATDRELNILKIAYRDRKHAHICPRLEKLAEWPNGFPVRDASHIPRAAAAEAETEANAGAIGDTETGTEAEAEAEAQIFADAVVVVEGEAFADAQVVAEADDEVGAEVDPNIVSEATTES